MSLKKMHYPFVLIESIILICLVCNIELKGMGARSDRFCGCLPFFKIPGTDKHDVAIRYKCFGNLETDPLIGTGYKGYGFAFCIGRAGA